VTVCKACNISGTCVQRRGETFDEACGIDVFKTAREQGLPLKVLRSKTEPRLATGSCSWVRIDSHGCWNLSSEHGEREGEAGYPLACGALPREGAT
jgi:hypothetical protein